MDVGSIKSSLIANSSGVVAERSQSTPASTAVADESVSTVASSVGSTVKVSDENPIAREDVESAVATIQDFVQSVRRDLNFSLEEGSGRVVVKVTDAGSGDVIRQIPSEEALQLAENLSEVRSLLFKAEA